MRRALVPAVLTVLAAATVNAQEGTPLLVATAERGIVLRWVWDEGARPAGYFIERRPSAGGGWTRLTQRPLTRTRDPAAARRLLGEQYDRYAGLLFPEDPRAERSDPEMYRGLMLLSADLEPGFAHALGLRYDDGDAVAGSGYQYRLVALTSTGEQTLATSGIVIAGQYRPAPPPDSLLARTSPRGAALRWNQAPRFSGYHVYRGSRRDFAAARRVNETPVVVFTRDEGTPIEASATFFTDTLAPRDSAWFWVAGIDAFGRVSQPSAPFRYVARPSQPLGSPVLPLARVAGDTVILTWQPPRDSGVVAFQVWRAENDSGPFTRVGPPVRATQRELRDPGRPARRLSYYRVTAVDRLGRESDPSTNALAEVPDLMPPPAPDSVAFVADTGRIYLRWRRAAALDVRGYRVYRAPAATGTFGLITATPLPSTSFVDTIRARADHAFYYRVTAVDSAFNESTPSAVIAARPPDRTPPSAPHIGQTRALETGIVVTWLANPESDIASYRVRYRGKGEAAWRDAPPARATQLADTVTGLTPGRTYEMTLVAIDDAGNVSASSATAERRVAARRAIARPDLRGASFVQSRGGVVVFWAIDQSGVSSLLVLRRENGQSLRPIAELPPTATQFVDRTVRTGRTYEYVVQARDAAGNASDSKPRRIEMRAPERGGGP